MDTTDNTLEDSLRSETPEPAAMSSADVIYKTLRLVPDFDGNSHVLPRFIHLCDQIVSEYIEANPNDSLAKLCLINGILNKITGPAARIINSNGVPEDWDSIKKSLINNFADQRDETTLYNDLMLATQGNNSPQEFYDHCVNLFSTIMTYVTLHESVKTTVEAKRTLYRKLTMQAFVRGLKEPLGSRIRCMRPDSVEKALEFVQEELNVLYLQNRHDPLTDKKSNVNSHKPSPLASSAHVANPMITPKPFNFSARNDPIANFQPQQMNLMRMPSHTQQMFRAPMFNTQPMLRAPMSHTQQIFRAAPPNYNRPNNNFQYPPRQVPQNTGPKPMSGIKPYVVKERPSFDQQPGHDWRRNGNPPPSNYFKTKEMNMNLCADYGDQFYYPAYYCEPYYNCYADNTEYYNIETGYCMENNGYYDNLALDYLPPVADDPQPSTSSAGAGSVSEQDFQKNGKSDKLK